MNTTLRFALVAALGAIGLSACDATAPPTPTVSGPVKPEPIPEGETLNDVVREALADVLRDTDPYSRARRLGALLPTLGPELVPAVEQTLEDPTLDFGAIEYELLLRYWATHQGEDASRWAVNRSPAFFRMAAILSSLTVWAEADPQAAVSAAEQWAARRPDLRHVLPKAVVRGWFAANPVELAQFIHKLGMGMPQQRALTTYIRIAIQKQGHEAVIRWAESLPDTDPAYKTTVYWQTGSALALFNLEAAVRWCETHCDGPYGKDLRSSISRRWARTGDGAAALAWLSSAPEGFEKDFAVRVTYEEWMLVDREAAMAWVVAQTTDEPDPQLQPILPVYARLLAEDSPADAIGWAERIEHDKKRRFILIEIAREWRQVDEAATEAWLLQSPLSEEDREKVRAAEWDRKI
jgi:hypothetical protein